MLPPVSIKPRPLINLWFQVQRSPFCTSWAFACKKDVPYSHTLIILNKSQFKNQAVHEQKFKDKVANVKFTNILMEYTTIIF